MSLHQIPSPKRHLVFAFLTFLVLTMIGLEVWALPVFLKHAKAQSASGTISVSMPSTSSPWSGTVNLTASLNGGGTASEFCFLIDGQAYPQVEWNQETYVPGGQSPCTYSTPNPATAIPNTFALDTTMLSNGPHQLVVVYEPDSQQNPVYGPITFTTNNGSIPYQLRSNYNELWLTPNQTLQLAPKLMNADGTSSPTPLGTLATGATYPGSFNAIYLGTVDEEIGSNGQSDGLLDFHIRLQGLKEVPSNVQVCTVGPGSCWGEAGSGYTPFATSTFDGQGNGDLIMRASGAPSFNVTVTYPDGSKVQATSTMDTSAYFVSWNPQVATVDNNGVVTAHAIGDATIGVSYHGFGDIVQVHVNDINATPQFGNDGSELTTYTPGKSTFVSSVFFLGPTTSTQLVSQVRAAGINTFEAGLPDTGGYATQGETQAQYEAAETPWESAVQSAFQIDAAAVAEGFNILYIGDGLARGTPELYQSTRGWDATLWNPNPISYIMTQAENIGRAIGVEMVDEVSSSWGNNPLPQGQLGQPGGPQEIVCVSDNCTVAWPAHGENGAATFLITGATSNPNLNRPITDLYKMANNGANSFTFTSTGVGTQTFTAQTDPNLTIQVFAYEPDGPYGPNVAGETDYTQNNAIAVLMNDIDSVLHPPISWPTAGVDPGAVGPWDGNPAVSDFATLYYPGFGGSLYPWGPTLEQAENTWQQYFNIDYPQVQRDKPVLFEGTGISQDYLPQYTPDPVVSMTNGTITLSEPDGVEPPFGDVGSGEGVSPRLTITGNSNPALDGEYYVYATPDANTLDVFLATSTLPKDGWQSGGVLTFPDGVSTTAYSAEESDDSEGLALALTTGQCAVIQNESFSQIVTFTSSTDPNYSGYSWYIPPDSAPCGGSGPTLKRLPSGTGTGGTADIVYNNLPPVINDNGEMSMVAADNITWIAAQGLAGARVYAYSAPVDQVYQYNTFFPIYDQSILSAGGIQMGINPGSNGQNSTQEWNAVGNAFNLIHDIEPYLLEPKLQSPDYGPDIVTAARSSSYGDMLMMINMSEAPNTQTVDLSQYNPSGGNGTIYRMTWNSLTNASISGTSENITFAPGETVVWTFPPAANAKPTISSFKATPASIPSGSSTALSWSVTGVPTPILTVTPGPGTVSGSGVSVFPTSTATYTLTATNSGGSATAQTTVTVTSSAPTSTPDTTPPSVPANLSVTGTTTSTVSLSWTASTDNVGVTGYKIYRGGVVVGTSTITSFTNANLTPSTTYTYTVSAYDAAGNNSTSSASVSATTKFVDTIPPTAVITSPVNNASLTGNITVDTTASDNVGVASVSLYIDDVLFATTSTAPYNFPVNTATLTNGTHILETKAYDAAGNLGTSPLVTVTTSNAAQTLTASLSASHLTGTAPLGVSLTATAGGTAIGTLNYIFYCDRPDTGTNVTSPANLTVNAVTATTYLAANLCTYEAVGTDTPKVIIQRGLAPAAQAQQFVTLSSPSGTPTSTPPVSPVTSVLVSNITDTSAEVTVVLPTLSSITLRYGPTTAYGQATIASPELTTVFENLTNLAPVTTYDFVVSVIPQGTTTASLSENYTFTTQATPVASNPSPASGGGGGGGSGSSGGGSLPPVVPPVPVTSTSTPTTGANPVTSPSTSTIPPVFPRNLTFGDTGPDVMLLQTVMKNLGFFNATTTITQTFGQFTEHAVLLFQNAHQLALTGSLDPQTQILLDKVVSANPSLAGGLSVGSTTTATSTAATATSTPPGTPSVAPGGSFTKNLAPGSSGAEVTLLQKTLFTDGDYPQDLVTGYYGSLTEAAVKAFQAKYGIVDYGSPETTGYGAVGPRTRKELMGV